MAKIDISGVEHDYEITPCQNPSDITLVFIHGWLLGIDPNRVKSLETAKKVKLYQTVAHKMLYAAFTPMSAPGAEAKLIISMNLIPKVMENQVNLANDVEFLQMQGTTLSISVESTSSDVDMG